MMKGWFVYLDKSGGSTKRNPINHYLGTAQHYQVYLMTDCLCFGVMGLLVVVR